MPASIVSGNSTAQLCTRLDRNLPTGGKVSGLPTPARRAQSEAIDLSVNTHWHQLVTDLCYKHTTDNDFVVSHSSLSPL
jgi:hypothetical protein